MTKRDMIAAGIGAAAGIAIYHLAVYLYGMTGRQPREGSQ